MKNKNYRFLSHLGKGLLMVLPFFAYSCIDVDDEYDLENIDMLVQVGTGDEELVFPTSNVNPIYLDNIVGVTEGNILSYMKDPQKQGAELIVMSANGHDELPFLVVGTGSTVTLNEVGRIDLMERPSWMDQNAVLDVVNPMMFLTFKNNAAANFKMDLTIVPYVKDKNGKLQRVEDVVKMTGVEVKSNGISYACVCDHLDADFIPEALKGKEIAALKPQDNRDVCDVLKLEVLDESTGKLVERVPDLLSLEYSNIRITDEGLPNVFVEKKLVIDTQLYAPLRLGQDFKFVYVSDELYGWASDLKDIDSKTSNIDYVRASGKVSTDLPVNVEFEAKAIDEAGNVIDGIQINTQKVLANAQDADVQFVLKAKNGKLSDYIGKGAKRALDGLVLNVIITGSVDGAPLYKKTYLRLSDVSIALKGKVVLDAN